jgi:hypothetical protein
MKLLKRNPAADRYKIYGLLHAWRDRAYGGQLLKTSDPQLRLSAWRSPGGYTFMVFPMTKDEYPYYAPGGYFVFERPTRLGGLRWADCVRTPHAALLPELRGRGIAKLVYRWVLDAGYALVTGNRQTPDSHALWRSLAKNYELALVGKAGVLPSWSIEAATASPAIRLLLLGRGVTVSDVFRRKA